MHLIGSETSVHTLHKASCSIDQIEDIYALMAVELRAVLNGESSRLNEFQFVQAGVFLHKVLIFRNRVTVRGAPSPKA